MVTLYNVISKDGFIAREDGDEDFIPNELWPSTLDFIAAYDVLIMGRKTYEAVQAYDAALLRPFEELKIHKIIVSRDAAFVPKKGYTLAHSPNDALASGYGKNVLVSSGPSLNSQIVTDGLADKIIWWRLNESIEDGIKPFDIDTRNFLFQPEITPGPLGSTIEAYRVNNAYLIS